MAKVARRTCGPGKVEKAQEAKPAVSASSAEKAPMVREDANLSSTGLQRESEQQDPCGSAKQTGDRVSTSDPRERGMPDLSDAAMKDLIDTVETLTRSPCLESPEALNWRDPKYGMTALGFAALWGFRNVVGLLLRHCYEHGVEVAPLLERHGLSTEFHTPLFTAAIDGHDDILTQLVPHIPVDHPAMTEQWQVSPGQSLSDASVSSKGDGAEAVTLGMCVAAMGHPDVLRSLLAAGAPMTAAPTNRWLTDALTLAIDYPDLTPPTPSGEAAPECRLPLPPVCVVPRPPSQGAFGEAPLGPSDRRTPSASGEASTEPKGALLSKAESVSDDNACSTDPKGGVLSKPESVSDDNAWSAEPKGGALSETDLVSVDNACSAEPKGGVLSETESVSDDNACSAETKDGVLAKTETVSDDNVCSAEPKGGALGEAVPGGMVSTTESVCDGNACSTKPSACSAEPNAGSAEPEGGALGEAVPGGMLSHGAGDVPVCSDTTGSAQPNGGALGEAVAGGMLSHGAGELLRGEAVEEFRRSAVVAVVKMVNNTLEKVGQGILSRLEDQLERAFKLELPSQASGPAVDGRQCQATPTEAEISEGVGKKRDMVARVRYLRFELSDWRAAQVRVAESSTMPGDDYRASLCDFIGRVESCALVCETMVLEGTARREEQLELVRRKKEQLRKQQNKTAARRQRQGGGGGGGGVSKAVLKTRLGTLATASHAGGEGKGSANVTSEADEEGPPAPQPPAPSPLTGPQQSTQCAEAAANALKVAEEAGLCPVAASQGHERDAGMPQPHKKEADGDGWRTRKPQGVHPEGGAGSEAQEGGVNVKGGAGEGSLRGGRELRRGHLDCILLLLRTRMYGITPRQRNRVLAALDRANDDMMVVRRLRRFMDTCLRECKFCGQWGHWHLCRRCMCTAYCSMAHHRADWRHHRQTCSPATSAC